MDSLAVPEDVCDWASWDCSCPTCSETLLGLAALNLDEHPASVSAATTPADDPSHMEKKFCLLDLPIELRVVIYEYTFLPTLVPPGDPDPDCPVTFEEMKVDMEKSTAPEKALVLTCRQISRETKALYQREYRRYWERSRFVLDCTDNLWRTIRVAQVRVRELQHVNRLHIHVERPRFRADGPAVDIIAYSTGLLDTEEDAKFAPSYVPPRLWHAKKQKWMYFCLLSLVSSDNCSFILTFDRGISRQHYTDQIRVKKKKWAGSLPGTLHMLGEYLIRSRYAPNFIPVKVAPWLHTTGFQLLYGKHARRSVIMSHPIR